MGLLTEPTENRLSRRRLSPKPSNFQFSRSHHVNSVCSEPGLPLVIRWDLRIDVHHDGFRVGVFVHRLRAEIAAIAKELGLEPGKEVHAVIKASDVILATD